jgi:hypothetical protein
LRFSIFQSSGSFSQAYYTSQITKKQVHEAPNRTEKQVREALQTEDVAVAIIAIGSCPETFKVARSERIPVSEIIVKHGEQS